ncbi:MAG: ABC transporter permease, partial [Verrucomicrobia bacterium]|nr:ABC transporter permease [Verrucomicrobiota bacterium]
DAMTTAKIPADAVSDAQFHSPSAQNWLGTDIHGRDLLSRIASGSRVSLLVGLVGAGVSFVIGVLWGAVAGYLGGRWDSAMMRAVDVLYSLPSIIFVIVLVTTLNGFIEAMQSVEVAQKMPRLAEFVSHFGAQLKPISPDLGRTLKFIGLFAGLGAVSWLTMARIVRGQVLTLRTRQFVDASRALGASHPRILLRHILPNVIGIIIVYLTLLVPAIILYESFLSYLGLGVQPPQASLGSLIAEGAGQINPIRIYWWLIVFPGAALVSLLLALNFLGDGLRDALDPRAER